MGAQRIGVTHHDFDFDGGSCMWLMQQMGTIEKVVFGDDELAAVLAGKPAKLFFADTSPKHPVTECEIEVYDHHQREGEIGHKTAFDLITESTDISFLRPDRLAIWKKLVKSGDSKSETDDMDIMRALKRVLMHLKDNHKAYTEWFSPLIKAFFANEPNANKGAEMLGTALVRFIRDNPSSPAKKFMLKWLERVKRPETIISGGTHRNILHFMSCMDEASAKAWIKLLLDGLHSEQLLFQEGVQEFKKSRFSFFGDTLLISAVTKNQMISKVARNVAFSPERNVPEQVKNVIKNRNSLWIVLQVHPESKNFQIFANGAKELCHKTIRELIKAIRSEMLSNRDMPVPAKEELSLGGTLAGTEPLYYHDIPEGYPSILYGSLKHIAKEPPVAFGKTAAKIHDRLAGIIALVMDKNEFAEGCNPNSCGDCFMHVWQLEKCQAKRESNQK